jgi:PKD repeat protein
MKRLFIYILAFNLLNVQLIAQPIANFTFSPSSPCSGQTVSFTNTSTGANSYFWEFGDGTTSTSANPTHSFTASAGNGTQQFFVKLTARQGSQTNSVTQPIDVLQPPDATIIDPLNYPPFAQCGTTSSFALTVNNVSTTNNSLYQIVWGDGSAPFSGSTFTSQSHTYNGFSAWDLVFTVTGSNGCVNSMTYQVFNGSNPSLGVSSPGGTTGCAPLTLNFEVSNTATNFGTTYTFQFNDGSEIEEYSQADLPSIITHTFNESSCNVPPPDNFYKLIAKATNACGFINYEISPIDIDREPIAVIQPSVDTVCLGDPVTFSNLSEPPCGANPALTNFTWIIDGNSIPVGNSMADQVYTYSTAGLKTVSLTALNSQILACNGGQSTTSVDIFVIDSEVPEKPTGVSCPVEVCQGAQGVVFTVDAVANATSYTWNLPQGATILSGEGTNTITVNFSVDAVTGIVEVTVRGENPCQEGEFSDPIQFIINPLPSPAGEIDGIPSLCQGQVAEYTYTVPAISNCDAYVWSVPPLSTILSGQGTNSITVNFPADATSGNISVYGINDCGDGAPSSLFIQVQPIPSDAITINGPPSACQGDEITLTVPVIPYTDLYVWTMADGSVITTPSNTVTFTVTGTSEIATFQVYGANPCGIGNQTVLIIPVFPSPLTNFAPIDHCHGQPAPLVDTTITPDNDIILWIWDFGDGYSSNLSQPIHLYSDSGTYTVTLAVTSSKGCNSNFETTITVQPTPEAHHRPIPVRTSIINPLISFKDSSFFARAWYWDFGDSTFSFDRNPEHAYSKVGTFQVMEIVSSGFGCPDTAWSEVVIYEGIYVPNAFMPGSGGGGGGGGGGGSGNDTGTFSPLFGVRTESNGYSFMIFNRWGEMVFETTSTDEGWNGTIRNTGNQAPVGVYVWKITYKELGTGKIKSRTGNVMLLR